MADKHNRTELSPAKRTSLLGLYNSDGYQVILDILEALCNQAENDFLSTDPENDQAVLVAHKRLHFQRLYFQEFIRKVDLICTEEVGVPQQRGLDRLQRMALIASALPELEL